MLAKGDKEEFDEEDDESTLMAESPKQTKLGDSSKQAEPKVGTRDVVGDVGKQGHVEPITNQEDITKDYACVFVSSICIYMMTTPL